MIYSLTVKLGTDGTFMYKAICTIIIRQLTPRRRKTVKVPTYFILLHTCRLLGFSLGFIPRRVVASRMSRVSSIQGCWVSGIPGVLAHGRFGLWQQYCFVAFGTFDGSQDICERLFAAEQELRDLGLKFHAKCMKKWLETNNETCPFCRA